jgi:nucleoid-associated protein YgaU
VTPAPAGADQPGQWMLLSYRLPREPSTPRIALWRRLKRLGVVQVSDGLVALPADARTREQLDWIAEEVQESGGQASVWLATPTAAVQERVLAQAMATARAAEYTALSEAARAVSASSEPERGRALARLSRQWREITRRDFFPPAERELAAEALRRLRQAEAALDVEREPR